MNRAAGYTARWHLLNGLPVPQGEPMAFVLAALEPHLGKPQASVQVDETDDETEERPEPKGYPETLHSTKNMGGTMRPLGIVFHSSYGSAAGSLSWIKNPSSRVSYHTLIFPDGHRHNVVPYDRQAWHAGRSSFRGRSGCNSFMIGLAFEGDLYRRQLTEDEIESAVGLAVDLARKYGFGLDWVTDHRTVSPGRKEDIPPAVLAMLRERIAAAL